jgi:hypothetical protein
VAGHGRAAFTLRLGRRLRHRRIRHGQTLQKTKLIEKQNEQHPNMRILRAGNPPNKHLQNMRSLPEKRNEMDG